MPKPKQRAPKKRGFFGFFFRKKPMVVSNPEVRRLQDSWGADAVNAASKQHKLYSGKIDGASLEHFTRYIVQNHPEETEAAASHPKVKTAKDLQLVARANNVHSIKTTNEVLKYHNVGPENAFRLAQLRRNFPSERGFKKFMKFNSTLDKKQLENHSKELMADSMRHPYHGTVIKTYEDMAKMSRP